MVLIGSAPHLLYTMAMVLAYTFARLQLPKSMVIELYMVSVAYLWNLDTILSLYLCQKYTVLRVRI